MVGGNLVSLSVSLFVYSLQMEGDISFTKFFHSLLSWSFVKIFLFVLTVSSCLAITYLFDAELFYFYAHTACVIFTFSIFIIFCLTPSKKYNGFFLFLGFGYLSVGFFLIVDRSICLHLYGDRNAKEQVWVAARY